MEPWENEYERQLARFPEPEPGWWSSTLPKARAGDESARQELLSRSLVLVLTAARRYRGAGGARDLHDLVEYGNYVLAAAIDSFGGSKFDQYVAHLEERLRAEWDRT